ncbi:MAG: di-heme oxidoredictase family protein [Pseudomonadota bacterium]
MRLPILALTACTLLSTAAAGLDGLRLDDPHLAPVPRTAAERARIDAALAPPVNFSRPNRFEALPAGAATVPRKPGRNAFSLPSSTVSFEARMDFNLGEALFEKLWVSSPSSNLASDGLGPLYNARSCHRCHVQNGRGHPPVDAKDHATSMLLRVSIPGGPEDGVADIAEYIATRPDPVYGRQLQDFSLQGHRAEYRLDIVYRPIAVALSGGEVAYLRKPTYRAVDLGYGPLHPAAMLSPRIAPQMIGLGLLEAIPVEDILAHADPSDRDGDGISGRPNIVWSDEFDRPMLGRFGLKAAVPTLRQQAAEAFLGDIGISTPLYTAGYGDCTAAQPRCRKAPHGDGDRRVTEVDAVALDLVTYFTANLGVPERRDADRREVLRGKAVFHATGCNACHIPAYVTHRLQDRPEHSFQLIWPYTDLLLHDMGPGLADNRPEARATGREWRTAPLWGIGLTEQVTGHRAFLHDGRARSLLEAILWHGGEAQRQRDAVVTMPPAERAALIAFLESL